MAEAVAVILGGAESGLEELAQTRELLIAAERAAVHFVINDRIASFAENCIAVTLHPPKLPSWRAARERAGYPAPMEWWAHIPAPIVTRTAGDWRGSSGLFSVKIALQKYDLKRIILCGVPMTAKGKHFVRHRDWVDVHGFIRGWRPHMAELAPFVRSWSGWTLQQFGVPTMEWLNGSTELSTDIPRVDGRALQGL